MSIRTQILLAVTAISALTICGFAAVVTSRVQARANQLAFEAAVESARFIGLVATHGLDQTHVSFDSALKTLQHTGWMVKLGGNGQATRLQLFDADAKLRFDSGQVDEDSAAGPDVEAALKGVGLSSPVLLRDSRVAAAEALRRGGGEGEILGAIRVIRPVLGVQEILQGLAPEIGALALGCVLLAALTALIVGRSISAPIANLTLAARKIAAGDRAYRLPLPKGSEVRALTDAYAEMRRELEDKREIERLSADLGHEFKNPIASVRALAEALEAGAAQDPVAGPRLISQIKSATQRMELILGDLLALARLEARGLDRQGPVDPQEVIRDAAEALAVRAAERGVKVELTAAAASPLRGDRIWLSRAIGNLLSNAIEHSEPGGTVRVVSEQVDGAFGLRIENQGEVPATVRERLFERFVTRRPEGTGLGLAIARSVAEAHGGSVALVEAGPPRVVLSLKLPRWRGN